MLRPPHPKEEPNQRVTHHLRLRSKGQVSFNLQANGRDEEETHSHCFDGNDLFVSAPLGMSLLAQYVHEGMDLTKRATYTPSGTY